VIEVLDAAIHEHGVPEIINSDQGSQFTSPTWVNRLKELGISISMGGRGRATDNKHLYRTVLENIETGLCIPVSGRERYHSLERDQRVYESLQQGENQPGSRKTNPGKHIPIQRMIIFICKQMYMYQMRHQAKSLTGFWKNLHSEKSCIFPKEPDLLICSMNGWFTNKKSKIIKKLVNYFLVKNPA